MSIRLIFAAPPCLSRSLDRMLSERFASSLLGRKRSWAVLAGWASVLALSAAAAAQSSQAPQPSGQQSGPVSGSGSGSGSGQTSFDPLTRPTLISPLTQPTITPGALLLMELEGRFQQEVATGGGKAFARWFADDAVTLSNGRPAVLGRSAIGAQATWDPKLYQLTWVPQGAQMGASNDMGYTWGHYEGRARDAHGEPVVTTGRYITIWKKQANGEWKVAMDASAEEPAAAGECCTLPKP